VIRPFSPWESGLTRLWVQLWCSWSDYTGHQQGAHPVGGSWPAPAPHGCRCPSSSHLAVAQQLRDHPRVDALGQQQRRGVVPAVVQPDVAHPGLGHEPLPGPSWKVHGGWIRPCTVRSTSELGHSCMPRFSGLRGRRPRSSVLSGGLG